ncbi:MAG: hypothetical protein ACIAQF_05705 [Phycisphaerales bacterium JB065]
MKTMKLRCSGALVAAAGMCVCSSQTRADVEYAYYVNSGIWGFDISHMSDLDQVRDGLPGNGGMHCVPTASMNMFAYVANHGFPEVFPGPGYWQASSGAAYDEMTTNLLLLGLVMGTTPESGTGGTGWQNGMEAVLDGTGKFDIINKWSGGSYSPTVGEMAQHVALGGIVAFAYGRYDIIGTVNGTQVLDRKGGHAVTMQKALASTPTFCTMWYRDPADGGSAFTQSPYGSRVMQVVRDQYRLDWQPLTVLNMERMVITPPPSDGRVRIIDQYMAIRPKAGYAFQPSSNGLSIILADINEFFVGETHHIDLSQLGGPMIDGIVNAEQTGVFVLVDPAAGGVERLYAVHPFEEEPRLVGELLRADHLAISPWGPVYGASAAALMCIDPDLVDPEPIEIPIPLPPCDISFDALNQKVVLLSPNSVLMTTPADLKGPVQQLSIPASVPLASTSSMSVSPADGTIWIITPGSDSMFGLTPVIGGPVLVEELEFEEIVRPLSIDVDDKGTLFVNTMDGLFCVSQDKAGSWTVKADELFGDLPQGSTFFASKSITNFDPENHVGPDFRHLFPEEILPIGEFEPDCPGDVVANGIVDLADLNFVLAQFGETVDTGTLGDANHDGVVDLTDLNLVLANFGVECGP